MKTFFVALVTVGVLLVPQKGFSGPALINPSTASHVSHAMGGADAGGTNGLNGDLIEHEQKNTEDLPGWREVVIPKLIELDRSIPNFSEHLRARAEELKWYFVKSEFDRLPIENTGIPVRTTQDAVQIDREVYVNLGFWKSKKSIRDKGLFILHELIEAQYFHIKKDTRYPFQGFREKITLSDVRRISDLVSDYSSQKQDEFAQELFKRNFGFYLNKNTVEKTKLNFIDTLKAIQRSCNSTELKGTKYLGLRSMAQGISTLYLAFMPDFAMRGRIQNCANSGCEQYEVYTVNFVQFWVQLNELFPTSLMSLENDLTNVPSNNLFDAVYPGRAETDFDIQAGNEVCSKLQNFDFSKIKESQRILHPRP